MKNEKYKTYKCCLFAKYYCAGLFFFLYTTDHESQMGSIKNLTYKQSHYWLIGIIETLSPSHDIQHYNQPRSRKACFVLKCSKWFHAVITKQDSNG